MISPVQKARNLLTRYNRLTDAVAQAKQCRCGVLSHNDRYTYWEQVIYHLEKLHTEDERRK